MSAVHWNASHFVSILSWDPRFHWDGKQNWPRSFRNLVSQYYHYDSIGYRYFEMSKFELSWLISKHFVDRFPRDSFWTFCVTPSKNTRNLSNTKEPKIVSRVSKVYHLDKSISLNCRQFEISLDILISQLFRRIFEHSPTHILELMLQRKTTETQNIEYGMTHLNFQMFLHNKTFHRYGD